jgi:hypothetical protein
LVNFLKSVEPLLNQGRVFYRESRPCQPFVFSSFETLKTTKSHPAYCFNRGAHSTPNRYLVNPSRKLFINRFPRKFKQLPPPAPALRTVPVRSGAHSTAPRKTVNGLREKNLFFLLGGPFSDHSGQETIKTRATFFLPA